MNYKTKEFGEPASKMLMQKNVVNDLYSIVSSPWTRQELSTSLFPNILTSKAKQYFEMRH